MRATIQKLKLVLIAGLTVLSFTVVLAGPQMPQASAASAPTCYSDSEPGKVVTCVTCKNNTASQVPSQADCPNDDCQNLSNCGIIKNYVNPAINLLAALVGIFAVISIVVAGIQYSSSGGEPAKASAAKMRIRNTIIALVAFALLWLGLNFAIPGGLTSL